MDKPLGQPLGTGDYALSTTTRIGGIIELETKLAPIGFFDIFCTSLFEFLRNHSPCLVPTV